VNDFNKVAKTPLEEWIYFLQTGEIPATATAPGLSEARKQMQLSLMDKAEREAYYRHLDNVNLLKGTIYTERGEGRLEGLAEGMQKGLEKGMEKGKAEERNELARKFKSLGVDMPTIQQATGLTEQEIQDL
jgi:predicted transposase/invertase (TIGR01784 family)